MWLISSTSLLHSVTKGNKSKARRDHDEWHGAPCPTCIDPPEPPQGQWEQPATGPQASQSRPAYVGGSSSSSSSPTSVVSPLVFWDERDHVPLLELPKRRRKTSSSLFTVQTFTAKPRSWASLTFSLVTSR